MFKKKGKCLVIAVVEEKQKMSIDAYNRSAKNNDSTKVQHQSTQLIQHCSNGSALKGCRPSLSWYWLIQRFVSFEIYGTGFL